MSSGDPASIRVLHVDDDLDLAAVVAEHLERANEAMEVVTATSATDALDRLAAGGDVDCVVSDHDMADVDGLEFLRAVRADHPDLPFILFTGKGSEEIASEAISAGVTDYLQKGTGTERYDVLAHRIEHAVAERRARDAREVSERLFSTLVENLPGMVYRCRTTAGWPMDYVSDGCEDLVGYAAEAIESGDLTWETDVIHPEDRDRVRVAVEEALAAGESYTLEYRVYTAKGELRWVWERGSRLDVAEDATYLVGFISDVTEQRRRREQLAAERDFTDSALNALEDAFYVVDPETGEFLRWNDRLAEFTGYSDDELEEMTVLELVPDEAVGDVLEVGERTLAGEDVDPYELEALTKSGERIPVEVRGAPLYDGDGDLIGIGSIARDISDRKRRERRLEEFASVVSHDLRNPLRVVQGRLELAQETGDLEHVEDAIAAADRMDELIDDLLALALQGETVGETELVDLGDLARDAWRTVETGDAALEVGDPGAVEADPQRLRDVFANLFNNAVEHSDVETRSLTLEQAVERAANGGPAESAPNRAPLRVRVGGVEGGFYVADDGPGIPPDEREEVFEHGFTTSEAGTGLGLSIVRRVANAHGWTVAVADSEWGGARFEFEA